jgi:hypothetical protein
LELFGRRNAIEEAFNAIPPRKRRPDTEEEAIVRREYQRLQNSIERINRLGDEEKAQARLLTVQGQIAKSELGIIRGRERLEALRVREERLRPKTLRERIRAGRERQRAGGFGLGAGATLARILPRERGAARRELFSILREQKLVQDVLGRQIKGLVDTRREAKSVREVLSTIGKTPVGNQFFQSLGINIEKSLERAKKGTGQTNKLLSDIGQTKVGRRVLDELGIHLDAAVNVGRTKGKKATEGVAQGMNRGFIESVSPLLASLPIRIQRDTPGLGNALNPHGKDLMKGLLDGIKSYLKVGSSLYYLLHGRGKKDESSILGFIRKWKGPIAYDQTVLVPAGQAIMSGLTRGLESGFNPVRSFLRTVGPAMEEFVPDGLFGDKVADFLVRGISGLGFNFPKVQDFFGGLIPDAPISLPFTGKLDKSLSFLHPSKSLADTSVMAQHLAKLFGLSVSSLYRPGAITSSGNISDHSRGLAADISGSTANTDRLAATLRPLFGRIFSQLIWRNRDLNRGYNIPGHMDHLHAAWIAAKNFTLGGGRFGGFREHGGSAQRGMAHVVGEAGPELFVPNRNGFVLSNDRVDRLLRALESGSRSTPFNQTVNLHTQSPDEAVIVGLMAAHTRASLGALV